MDVTQRLLRSWQVRQVPTCRTRTSSGVYRPASAWLIVSLLQGGQLRLGVIAEEARSRLEADAARGAVEMRREKRPVNQLL
ncbi:hypothetical protein ABZ250_05155 [Streptomyces afghaniensis]|uniref:hypothetical protein n=1 Tax=Streptomyces afghaniensis TaxID=66865 RepID=UPI0033BC5937